MFELERCEDAGAYRSQAFLDALDAFICTERHRDAGVARHPCSNQVLQCTKRQRVTRGARSGQGVILLGTRALDRHAYVQVTKPCELLCKFRVIAQCHAVGFEHVHVWRLIDQREQLEQVLPTECSLACGCGDEFVIVFFRARIECIEHLLRCVKFSGGARFANRSVAETELAAQVAADLGGA